MYLSMYVGSDGGCSLDVCQAGPRLCQVPGREISTGLSFARMLELE